MVDEDVRKFLSTSRTNSAIWMIRMWWGRPKTCSAC